MERGVLAAFASGSIAPFRRRPRLGQCSEQQSAAPICGPGAASARRVGKLRIGTQAELCL